MSILYTGQTRAVLIDQWGEPKKSVTVEGKKRDTFLLQTGGRPSGGRALGHAAMDAMTGGMWEIIGGSVEDGHSRGMWLTVEYDQDDKVTDAYPGDIGSQRE